MGQQLRVRIKRRRRTEYLKRKAAEEEQRAILRSKTAKKPAATKANKPEAKKTPSKQKLQ